MGCNNCENCECGVKPLTLDLLEDLMASDGFPERAQINSATLYATVEALERAEKERDEARERVTTMTDAWVKATAERDALKAALRELLENPSHPDTYLSGEHDKAVQRAREALGEVENAQLE